MTRFALAMAAVAALVGAPGAGAATVALHDEVVYDAGKYQDEPETVQVATLTGDDRADDVRVTYAGGVLTVTDAAGVQPGARCEQQEDGSVTCPAAALRAVRAALSGGDDAFTTTGIVELDVDGGAGGDRLDAGDGFSTSTLRGGPGDDALTGGRGPDVLDGGPGRDELTGGGGSDVADYPGRTDALRLEADGRPDSGAADEHDTIAPDVEQLAGGDGADVLVGGATTRVLVGRGGDDRLVGGWGGGPVLGELDGGAGDDVLIGGPAKEILAGGPGADRLDGGAGADRLSGDGSGITELSTASRAPGGPDTLLGGPGDDVLSGGDGRDRLQGGPGADVDEGDAQGADVEERDGTPDLIGCAPPAHPAGAATVDASDLVRGCSSVERQGIARPRLLLFGQTDIDPNGVLHVGVGCPQDERGGCPVAVTIALGRRVVGRARGRARPGTGKLLRPRIAARLVSAPFHRPFDRRRDCPRHRFTLRVRTADARGRPVVLRASQVLGSLSLACNQPSLLDSFTAGW